jgi:hypothetical protein
MFNKTQETRKHGRNLLTFAVANKDLRWGGISGRRTIAFVDGEVPSKELSCNRALDK